MAAARAVPARSLAVLLLAGASLAACSTPQPRFAARLPDAGGPVARPPAAQPPAARPTPVYKVGQPYQIGGVWYVPREQPDYDEEGIASWYGPGFHQKATANGEIFDQALVTAAHTTLPLPSWVEVTNLENGRKLELRVNDRGPFVGGRIIDLSQEAARRLGFEQQGTARVRVRYLGRAPLPQEMGLQYASNAPAATPAPAAPRPTLARSPSDVEWAAPRTVASRPAIETAELTSLPAAAAPLPPMAVTPVSTRLTEAAAAYRIQAGAFVNWDNARKRADDIDATGLARAKIETVYQGGENVYRVLVDGPATEDEAWSLRERLMVAGIAEARVVRR